MIIILGCLLFLAPGINAQWMIINKDGGTPDSSAALEVSDTSRGVLMPRLTSSQMNAISSPAEGLMIYNTDSSEFYYYNGGTWQSTTTYLPTSISNSGVAILYDQKTTSTDGGSFNSGSWINRTLNTLDGDSSFVSIQGDTAFVLQPGIYSLEWSCPAYKVDGTSTRLYNQGTSAIKKYGSSEFSAAGSVTVVQSRGHDLLYISVSNTYSIQHRAETTRATDGMGQATGFGNYEVFSQLTIIKIK